MGKSNGFQFQWPFPKNPNILYRCASKATLITVLSACKLIFLLKGITSDMNRISVINKNRLLSAVGNKSRPLITVSNHRSNMDDPLIWCKRLICERRFFSLGKCVPVVRGEGVYQKGVDFCIEKLAENQWIHIFPEGKVTPAPIRIKWGVARMIMESPNPPILLPIWIHGMAEVWPQLKPYYPRIGKHVTVMIGSEVDMKEHLWRFRGGSEPDKRKALADFVQKKLLDLGAQIGQQNSS